MRYPAGACRGSRTRQRVRPRGLSYSAHVQPPAPASPSCLDQPPNVLDDVGRLMRSVGYQRHLPRDKETALKINHSAGEVLPRLLDDALAARGGHPGAAPRRLRPALGTAATTARWWSAPSEGEVRNKHKQVQESTIPSVHLNDRGASGSVRAQGRDAGPRQDLPGRHRDPEELIGRNVVHLPTMKTHVFTDDRRDEERVRRPAALPAPLDALADPQDAGRPAGDPEGDPPRHLRRDGRHLRRRWPRPARHAAAREEPHPRLERQVAIDAVSAKLMGFDPMSLEFIRLAHEAASASATRTRSRSSARTSRRSTGASTPARHLRLQGTARDLPRHVQAAGELPAAHAPRRLGLRRLLGLPRLVLVPAGGQGPGGSLHAVGLGSALELYRPGGEYPLGAAAERA